MTPEQIKKQLDEIEAITCPEKRESTRTRFSAWLANQKPPQERRGDL